MTKQIGAFVLVGLLIVLVPLGAFAKGPQLPRGNPFKILQSQIDELKGQVEALESDLDTANDRIDSLESELSTANRHIADLQAGLTTIEGNSVLALDGHLRLDTVGGYAAAVFDGLNVQIVNGLGSTETANGLGNLIVGYYTERLSTYPPVCSDGQYEDQAACEGAGETWAVSHKTGSHNVVVGFGNNYSRWGGILGGYYNTSNQSYGTVVGGANNMASGEASSILGGYRNISSGIYSSVSGGLGNTATGNDASVSGGYENTASGSYANVGGGEDNTASGFASSVSGGGANTASGPLTSVLGGNTQSATGSHQTIPALP